MQCPGSPEHPFQPLGLLEITHWKPMGLLGKINRNLRLLKNDYSKTSLICLTEVSQSTGLLQFGAGLPLFIYGSPVDTHLNLNCFEVWDVSQIQ